MTREKIGETIIAYDGNVKIASLIGFFKLEKYLYQEEGQSTPNPITKERYEFLKECLENSISISIQRKEHWKRIPPEVLVGDERLARLQKDGRLCL